jgi:hypothetical protein
MEKKIMEKEGLRMTKSKSLIEKLWWVIPPVFMVFVFLPVFRWLDVGRYSFGEWIGIFQYLLGSIDGRIVTISMLGLMGIGYYLIRRKGKKKNPIERRIAHELFLW